MSGKGGRRHVPIPIGTRFGRRVVVGPPVCMPRTDDHGAYVYYRVRCDCGAEQPIRVTSLRMGHSHRCQACCNRERREAGEAKRALA